MTATTAADTEKPETEAVAPTRLPDLEVILPPPGECIIGGVKCNVKKLKARQFFALMGILTKGLGPVMGEVDFENMDRNEIGALITMGLGNAIPYAMDEFLAVIESLVEPVDSTEANVSMLRKRLADPEIEDMFPIIDAIVFNESDDIAGLLGKARAYIARWATTFRKARK